MQLGVIGVLAGLLLLYGGVCGLDEADTAAGSQDLGYSTMVLFPNQSRSL